MPTTGHQLLHSQQLLSAFAACNESGDKHARTQHMLQGKPRATNVCVCVCLRACMYPSPVQVSGALCNAGLSLSTPDLSINLVAVIHHLFLLHTASLQGMG